jgi:hypothetical protein
LIVSRTKRKTLAFAIVAIWLAAAGYIFATDSFIFQSGETQTSLIELFTSEGCSSCPPAEKWMSALKTNPDLWKKVVPIAFHVDYWDHLGWRDRFSKPQFTERQRRYAAAWDGDSIYTPEFALNGREWRGWFGGPAWPVKSEKVGALRVILNDRVNLTAEFVPQNAQARALTLNVALLGNDLQSDVARGENAGRKLRHDFVVLDLVKIDMAAAANGWTGSATLPREFNGDKATALAAWVTATETSSPTQATGGWLAPKK